MVKVLRTGKASGGAVPGGNILNLGNNYSRLFLTSLLQVLLALSEVGLRVLVWLWQQMEQLLGLLGILWLLWLLLVINGLPERIELIF